MPKKYTLSTVVLSNNAAKKIVNCLESLKGWADEIIIVDGGSTDGTADIARSFGAQFYPHDFLGAFSAERNFGTEKCSCDWVLQLDSDEIVGEDFKKKCDEILPDTPFAALKFHRRNVFLGHEFKYGGWYHWSQHLFRRGKARYEGRVHEKMLVDGQTGYLDADILHIPFDSISEFIDRQNRYTDLQAADIIDTEKDLSIKNIKYNLKIRPLKLFRKIYFKKKGYREGYHGLVFALLSSWVHFLKWAKVWEILRYRKNILVIRNDRFGEFLLNIPAIRALKETFKDSRVILAVNPYVKELAGKVPYADEVIEWKSGKHSFREILKFSKFLKSKNIDIAVIMNPSKDSNLAVYLAGIPKRVGYARKWDFLLNDKIEDRKHLEEKHEVEYNLDLVKVIGAEVKDTGLFLNTHLAGGYPTCEVGTIAIHPWTSDPVKQWPEEHFKELALRLVRDTDSNIVIIGGKEELGRSVMFDKLNSRIRNMTGKTSLVELADLLKNCRLLVSGDSGPVHLASAVGTPVIALFRSDIPGKGPKRWAPWGKNNIVIAKNRLSDISVDEVMERIYQITGLR